MIPVWGTLIGMALYIIMGLGLLWILSKKGKK